MEPAERTPIRISDFKKTNREKQEERRDRNQASDERPAIICGLRPPTSDLWLRPVFPTQPEKICSEEWDQPAVAVLLVDRPLVAQLPAEDKPKRTDGGDNECGASKTAVASCGYGVCLGENGSQSALIISQEPKDL